MDRRSTYIYNVCTVAPYINWAYFYHAWSMTGKPDREKEALHAEAVAMLEEMDQRYRTHAVLGLFDANSDGDDIVLHGTRLPMLRQQRPPAAGEPTLSLADFVRPLSSGIADTIGLFATTVDAALVEDYRSDLYRHMLAQTLADRLAEATAEKLHEDVRKEIWGYAPDESLTTDQLHREEFQGIRPAVGYPSLPDTSVNFILSDLLDMPSIGIRLTESGMMIPHASVSGFMFAHPQARYFHLGKIGEDQLRDYARRRGMAVSQMRKFLSSNLLKK